MPVARRLNPVLRSMTRIRTHMIGLVAEEVCLVIIDIVHVEVPYNQVIGGRHSQGLPG